MRTLTESRRLALVSTVLAVVVAAVVVIAAAPGNASSNNEAAGAALSRVSVRGTAKSLPFADPWSKRLIDAGFTDVRLIGSASGTDFYRLTKKGRKSCYGVGPTGVAAPGFIGCSETFPSPESPIMNLSIVGADKGSGEDPHLITVQGIAADGVATVELRNASKEKVARVPVKQNVFVLKEVPNAAIRVVGLDSNGMEVGRDK